MADPDSSLRARLRADTTQAHQQLDDQISRFDIGTAVGLSSFMMLQSAGHRWLAANCAAFPSRDVALDLAERADRDLLTLGWDVNPLASLTLPAASLDPLAVDYMVCGARLGSMVLKQRWAASDHSGVLNADAYFSAPRHVEYWADFCDRSGAKSASGPAADRCLADANAVFTAFGTLCTQAQAEVATGDGTAGDGTAGDGQVG